MRSLSIKVKIAGYLPAILSCYVYLSFSIRFPVHLYYPAAVRTFQRHDNPAGTRLPNVTGPLFAPPLRAFHFPDNTTSLPQIHLLLSPHTDMEQGNQPVPAGSLLSFVYYWFSFCSPIPIICMKTRMTIHCILSKKLNKKQYIHMNWIIDIK